MLPDISPDPPHRDPTHGDVSWFLRRELLTLPLTVAIVAVLLVFGITPATLLFVALLTVVTLGCYGAGAGAEPDRTGYTHSPATLVAGDARRHRPISHISSANRGERRAKTTQPTSSVSTHDARVRTRKPRSLGAL